MTFLKELYDFFRFMWHTPSQKKQVVFYAESASYYAYFEGLVEEIVDKRGQEICYITSDPQDPILQDKRPGINPFFISSLLPYFTMMVQCRVFVMTLTDLDKYHFKRSLYPAHYVYVFHSMVSTQMMYRDGSFDHYDSILCVGPHHVAELAEYEEKKGTQAKQLVPGGYYRLERIHAKYQEQLSQKTATKDHKTILIAPSWGEHNLIKSCGEELVAPLLAAGYRVIVRPHPETFKREPEMMAGFDKKFAGNTNYTLERSVSTDESLLTADLMICDLSGVALEYALGTERPVLFVDLPPKIQNHDYKFLTNEPVELSQRNIMGELMPVDDLPMVADRVDRMLAAADQYRLNLSDLRDKLVFDFGNSSTIGADHILKVAKEKW